MLRRQPIVIAIVFLLLGIIMISGIGFYLMKYREMEKNVNEIKTSYNQKLYQELNRTSQSENQNKTVSGDFAAPLGEALKRVTKKPFGIYITPETSPVQPERFSGYHTGTDFEVFSDELGKDVTVNAICDGKLLVKQNVNGYGGVAVQSCMIGEMPVTVLYGHLSLESIKFSKGETITKGSELGELGKDKSAETDGERKHLHLSIIKGDQVDYRGYTENQKELLHWLDPCLYVCFK